jgi:(p)ppGpp synthase/HD superfamily hydrolase
VMEDTHITKAEIAERFGRTTAELVDGSPSSTRSSSSPTRKPRPKTSARCCWRWPATCGSS